MKKIEKSRGSRKSKQDDIFPFERENFLILAAGVVVIILGYIALSGSSVEGTMPLVVSPILLILGYCVIIPVGILYRKKEKAPPTREATPPVTQ